MRALCRAEGREQLVLHLGCMAVKLLQPFFSQRCDLDNVAPTVCRVRASLDCASVVQPGHHDVHVVPVES